jgi:hypothetical protein
MLGLNRKCWISTVYWVVDWEDGDPSILSYCTSEMRLLIVTSHGCRKQDRTEGLEPFGVNFVSHCFPSNVAKQCHVHANSLYTSLKEIEHLQPIKFLSLK